MMLKDLIAKLQAIQDEVGEGPPHETWKGDVQVLVKNDNLNAQIVEVEPSMAAGCGCWTGAYIWIEVHPD